MLLPTSREERSTTLQSLIPGVLYAAEFHAFDPVFDGSLGVDEDAIEIVVRAAPWHECLLTVLLACQELKRRFGGDWHPPTEWVLSDNGHLAYGVCSR